MPAGRTFLCSLGVRASSRRFVDIVSRDAGMVGIRSGLKAGDRVVTRGAYDVQLASAADRVAR